MLRSFYYRLRIKRRLATIKHMGMRKLTPLERDMNLLEEGVI